MIVVDTTVLVYAVGADHEFREPSRTLVEGIRAGAVRASTTVEVIQEFAHVRARGRGRKDAMALAAAFADLLAPLLVTTEAHLRAGLALWGRHTSLGAFDAILAAAASDAGATALVSSDRVFARVREVHHVVPDALAVARLLAAAGEPR